MYDNGFYYGFDYVNLDDDGEVTIWYDANHLNGLLQARGQYPHWENEGWDEFIRYTIRDFSGENVGSTLDIFSGFLLTKVGEVTGDSLVIAPWFGLNNNGESGGTVDVGDSVMGKLFICTDDTVLSTSAEDSFAVSWRHLQIGTEVPRHFEARFVKTEGEMADDMLFYYHERGIYVSGITTADSSQVSFN